MKKTIKDFDLNDKRVIIRCDFNVPIKDGKIIDDTRIRESLKTINYAIDHKAKVILMSHLGRIKEEKDLVVNDLTVVCGRLKQLLNREVLFCKSTHGKELNNMVSNLNNGEILLMQNTRYEDLDGKKESSNNESLGKYWASLGDIFINDAFGTIHRSHASNVGISSYISSGIGFLVEKELNELDKLLAPQRPFVVILGGAKVNDKIGVINNLVLKADKLLIGGAMAFTFLKAKGFNIGNSLLDADNILYCQNLLKKYPDKILLPVDCVSGSSLESVTGKDLLINELSDKDMGLDIGPKTVELYKNELLKAKTVFWNGPMGIYETEAFSYGTRCLLDFIRKQKSVSILGGGDIVACANKYNLVDGFTHLSTGGGATLSYLSGEELPGLKNIQDK